jgi:hypothetical protein
LTCDPDSNDSEGSFINTFLLSTFKYDNDYKFYFFWLDGKKLTIRVSHCNHSENPLDTDIEPALQFAKFLIKQIPKDMKQASEKFEQICKINTKVDDIFDFLLGKQHYQATVSEIDHLSKKQKTSSQQSIESLDNDDDNKDSTEIIQPPSIKNNDGDD